MKQLVAFYLPLPRPMAIPANTGFIGLREEPVTWLADGPWPDEYRQLQNSYFQRNRNLVLFQLAQQIGTPTSDLSQLHAAFRLADKDAGRTREEEPEDWTNFRISHDDRPQLTQTIIKMATPLIATEDDDAGHAISDAFDHCMEELHALEAAYAQTARDIVYELTTRNSCSSACPYILWDSETESYAGPFLFMINATIGYLLDIPKVLSPSQVEAMRIRMELSKIGATQMVYSEWMRNAYRSARIAGNYAASVVQAYTASEVLLDSVLLMMTWEEIEHANPPSLTLDEVASWFSVDRTLSWRVRNQYKTRLKPWQLERSVSPLGRWMHDASLVRNRVVHTGYVPTEREASSVLEIVTNLEKHIKELLISNRNRTRYPRTVLLQLGREGVQRRGKYTGKLKQLDEASMQEAWQGEYIAFRNRVDQTIAAQKSTG